MFLVILINNAGINYISDITSITIDKVSEMMQVNVISPMFLTLLTNKSLVWILTGSSTDVVSVK